MGGWEGNKRDKRADEGTADRMWISKGKSTGKEDGAWWRRSHIDGQ